MAISLEQMESRPGAAPEGSVDLDRYDFWVVPHTHWDREWYQPLETWSTRSCAQRGLRAGVGCRTVVGRAMIPWLIQRLGYAVAALFVVSVAMFLLLFAGPNPA